MEEKILKIMKVQHEGAESRIPQRATGGSAGLDLCAALSAPVIIAPGEIKAVPTGIAIALPGEDTVGLIYARSGLAVKHGITLANSVGVIDSDYRGEIIVGLINLSAQAYTIEPGERIAQLVVAPVCPAAVKTVGDLGDTGRASGGFGSTGRK